MIILGTLSFLISINNWMLQQDGASSGRLDALKREKQERYETSWRTIGRDDSYPVLGRSEP